MRSNGSSIKERARPSSDRAPESSLDTPSGSAEDYENGSSCNDTEHRPDAPRKCLGFVSFRHVHFLGFCVAAAPPPPFLRTVQEEPGNQRRINCGQTFLDGNHVIAMPSSF